MESERWPQWDEVAGHSPATKGPYETFSALQMKHALKEPAMGEAGGRWWCPWPSDGQYWRRVTGRLEQDASVSPTHSIECAKDFIGAGSKETLRTFVVAATSALRTRAPRPVPCPPAAATSRGADGESGSECHGSTTVFRYGVTLRPRLHGIHHSPVCPTGRGCIASVRDQPPRPHTQACLRAQTKTSI